MHDTFYNTKHKYYKKEKIISRKYRQAVCTIKASYAANGLKKKLDEFKNSLFKKKLFSVTVNFITSYYFFID